MTDDDPPPRPSAVHVRVRQAAQVLVILALLAAIQYLDLLATLPGRIFAGLVVVLVAVDVVWTNWLRFGNPPEPADEN